MSCPQFAHCSVPSKAASAADMTHPQSPHRASSADLSGDLGAALTSRSSFCTSGPLHSCPPLSSPSSQSMPALAPLVTTLADAPPKDSQHQSALMAFEDNSTLPWSSSMCGLPLSRMENMENGAGYRLPLQFSPDTTALYSYSTNGLPYSTNYDLTYTGSTPVSSCPRSYTTSLDVANSADTMSEAHPPSAYLIEPQKPQDVMESTEHPNGQLLEMYDDYEQRPSAIKVEDSGYGTPLYQHEEGMVRAASTPQDEPLPPQHLGKSECVGEEGAIDKEQPYAQLIYRALMEAPGHTMILRDIYNWFKINTDKAADKETKGWQNSIRHNLSMNGAFEKVDQPCEDAKKGFMWRLTEEAIREGVKSTTRYRSKQPNKRGHRSQHPQPQRQASGARGGQASRRSAKFKRSHRLTDNYGHRTDPYISRSVPAGAYSPPFDPLPSTVISGYPLSPYYSSEADFSQSTPQDDFGCLVGESGLDLLPDRSYSASPLRQCIYPDGAYMLPPCSPTDPLFYGDGNSSSSGDEPMTPDSVENWPIGTSMAMPTSYMFDDMAPNYMQ